MLVFLLYACFLCLSKVVNKANSFKNEEQYLYEGSNRVQIFYSMERLVIWL